MKKYLPIESEAVDAAFWDSSETGCVGEVIDLLREFGFVMTLDTNHDGYDIDLEVRNGKELVHTVPDRTFLIIHANHSVESMSATSFFKTYRAA